MLKKRKSHIFTQKLIYTIGILIFYIVGRSVPLYGINLDAYKDRVIDAETILMQTIGGDIYQNSIFSLGISPYMIATLSVQIIYAMRSSDSKSKFSKKKQNRIILEVFFLISLVQALLRLQKLEFVLQGDMLFIAQGIAVLEMIAGATLILLMAERNKQYGIGGQTALILVNVIYGIMLSIKGQDLQILLVPLLVSIVALYVMSVMEYAEKRISVQRISIHSIFADKNYLAIKLNPIGVMPIMFSTAFFMLPQLILAGINYLFPEYERVKWLLERMKLTHPLGIVTYLIILYILTIGFSRIMINPKDLAENLLKSGDSLTDIRPGKDTRKYLSRELNRIGFLSSTVMAVCLGASLWLQLDGEIDSALMMLPSSFMMLIGIWSNLYREAEAVRNFDSYKPFI